MALVYAVFYRVTEANVGRSLSSDLLSLNHRECILHCIVRYWHMHYGTCSPDLSDAGCDSL